MKRSQIALAAASVAVILVASLNLSAKKFGSTAYYPNAAGVCTIPVANRSVVNNGTAPINGPVAPIPGPCTHTVSFVQP